MTALRFVGCQSLDAAIQASDASIVETVRQSRIERGRPIAVGLAGPQGSGKSTMANRLANQLISAGLPAAVLSLDDFYLCYSERLSLARSVHPLLATRGVPGTHNVEMALNSLVALLEGGEGKAAIVPVFDKASDDRAPVDEWRQISGPVEIVIFEGWCVGARAQPTADLERPINELECQEDLNGSWRRYANDQLAGSYRRLFERLDLTVLLRAPSFNIVEDWRAEQEAGLVQRGVSAAQGMDRTALRRFIAHYERLTRWMARDEPADIIIDLDDERVPRSCRTGSIQARG